MNTKKQDKFNDSEIKRTLMRELKFDNLADEKQDELIAKMGEVILKKIFIETVEKLDVAGRKHFEKMLNEERTPVEIEEFLKLKIQDYDEIVERIIKELKNNLMDNF